MIIHHGAGFTRMVRVPGEVMSSQVTKSRVHIKINVSCKVVPSSFRRHKHVDEMQGGEKSTSTLDS